MLQSQHLSLSSNCLFPLSRPSLSPLSTPFLNFLSRHTTTFHSLSSYLPTSSGPWLAQVPESAPDDGPVELPPSIFATDNDPSTLQVATSVLLTGAISVFLFRSLRRRAKRAKELKFRSSGAKKTLKEEAIANLKAMTPTPLQGNSPPSPVQALLGGLSAGVIALILYKFTTTIEASLNRQTISDNFSVRQITVTIRTIINGICYLATFVFGINSVGLILYSGQLALNSIMGDSPSEDNQIKEDSQLSSKNPTTRDSPETNGSDGDQSSDSMQ